MYLLPIFTACLLLGSRGIWLTTLYVSGLHLGEQAAEFGASGDAGWLQALARVALLFLSASIISRLARAEREAKSAAQAQRQRLERALEESSSSARAARAAENPADPDAGRLMHEMNSVMTVILGSAQFLLLEYPMDGPMTQDLRRVESATKRLIGIAEKLGSAIKGQAMPDLPLSPGRAEVRIRPARQGPGILNAAHHERPVGI
jgi:signal transduction histidine kinase